MMIIFQLVITWPDLVTMGCFRHSFCANLHQHLLTHLTLTAGTAVFLFLFAAWTQTYSGSVEQKPEPEALLCLQNQSWHLHLWLRMLFYFPSALRSEKQAEWLTPKAVRINPHLQATNTVFFPFLFLSLQIFPLNPQTLFFSNTWALG